MNQQQCCGCSWVGFLLIQLLPTPAAVGERMACWLLTAWAVVVAWCCRPTCHARLQALPNHANSLQLAAILSITVHRVLCKHALLMQPILALHACLVRRSPIMCASGCADFAKIWQSLLSLIALLDGFRVEGLPSAACPESLSALLICCMFY